MSQESCRLQQRLACHYRKLAPCIILASRSRSQRDLPNTNVIDDSNRQSTHRGNTFISARSARVAAIFRASNRAAANDSREGAHRKGTFDRFEVRTLIHETVEITTVKG